MSSDPSGLLVVERTLFGMPMSEASGHGYYPVEAVLQRYRGIEGYPWPDLVESDLPLADGLVPVDMYSKVAKYFGRVRQERHCDLLYVAHNTPGGVASLPESLVFLGFDFGSYLSEYNHYSVIFHEVIFGLYADMRGFASQLNDHMLLPTADVARSLATVRAGLLAAGADLEYDEDEVQIAVFGDVHMLV